MDDLLALSAGLPEVDLDAGEVLVHEGAQSGSLWVLVGGSLSISKGDMVVNTVDRPGAVIGEISVLLDTASTATVTASEKSRLRHAVDGRTFLFSEPQITRTVTVGLAERLNFVTTYLADLKRQYGEAPGLSMMPAVLQRLAEAQARPAVSGSRRDPDPEY